MCGKHIERKGLINSISWRIKMKKQFLVIFLIPNLWDYRGTKVVWGYGINAETSIHLSFKEKRKGKKERETSCHICSFCSWSRQGFN